MSIRLIFEIGHNASRKTKPSKEGFTHDWELFVRGEAGSEIVHFVDKVVFILHESFPKPKRVVKEPPYTVKESGYAAFIVKVEIHFKNREEPKKVVYDYDLDLLPTKLQAKEFIVQSSSEEFRRKCLKGGGQLLGEFKSRDPHHKPSSSSNDIKKISKRPEEIIVKPNDKFHDIFGQPLSRAHQNPSPIPSKSTSTKPAPSSSTKDKPTEKPKHKHSPTKDGSKDQTKKSSQDTEKVKKDKVKDRERSEKKEKTSKRPSSPSPSSSMSSSSARNSVLPVPSSLKPDSKTKSKSTTSSATAISTSDPAFIKKSSKKDKKSDKDRERNDKKDQRKFESPPKVKDREAPVNVKEEKKVKTSPGESKIHQPTDTDKRQPQHDKDAERKHKHKKKDKDKSKDKEAERDIKKEKTSKNSSYQAKAKEIMKSQTPISEIESDIESPPSIKQESENSNNSDSIPPKLQVENKKPEKRSKNDSKEEKPRKRKAAKDQDLSISPPPKKGAKVDTEKSSNDSHSHNNNNVDDGMKLTNEYISELKELKQKITGLKNNEEIQHVVKIIASTGCYEITKSSFDFDLIQLDRPTVQSLLEMFKLKK